MNWETKKFSQIMMISKGESITRATENEGKYPVILGGQEPAYYIDRYNHSGKAIVVSRSGASAGYVSFWNEPIFITDGFLVEPKNEEYHHEFIYYLLKYYGKVLRDLQNGSAIPHVTPKTIYGLKASIPTLKEQRRIVSFLSAYDNLIEVNNKRIKVLEQMAENLYKEWFVRFRFPGHESTSFETGIPKDWEIKKVKDIVKRLPFGRLYKTEDTEKEGKVIVIDQSQDEYVGFHNDVPSHVATKDSPIVLFGDHSCKQQLMTRPFSLSENVVPFVGKEGILTTYLYYLTHGIVETTEYKRHWSEFVAKKVIIAPVELQIQYVDTVNPWISLIEYLTDQNRKLIKQRDLLLPRLMSGKLEV